MVRTIVDVSHWWSMPSLCRALDINVAACAGAQASPLQCVPLADSCLALGAQVW